MFWLRNKKNIDTFQLKKKNNLIRNYGLYAPKNLGKYGTVSQLLESVYSIGYSVLAGIIELFYRCCVDLITAMFNTLHAG